MPGSNTSKVFHRSLRHAFPRASAAGGVYINDASGRRYLDASGGAAVSCLGHGETRVIEAVKQQLDRMAFAHTSFFTNEPAEQLAQILSDKAPGGHWRTYFLSGGSEVNEAALKLARQIQVERGQSGRDHYIARHRAYHGNTFGALAVGGRADSRALFGPVLSQKVARIMPCYAYREQRPEESDVEFGLRAARALEDQISQLGKESAVAFIAETVAGATLGCVPPAPGYFKEIRRICDDHGILMILDEVMCGMGRCGTLFACERDGVTPDMICVAKGIGAGYQPLGALMVREELAAEIENGSGAFNHGHTYVGHATACAAGLAVQRVFEEDDLIARCAATGERLDSALRAGLGDHDAVGDIRGRGLFRGIELVSERAGKTPFPATWKLAARVKQRAMDNGLICYPMSGGADGERGDHILLAPPFIFDDSHIEELVEKLTRAIDQAIGDARATNAA